MQTLITKILLVLSLFTFISTAIAEELKLCGTQWPPFTYAEEGKIVKGVSYEIYQEAFKRLGWQVEMDHLPWPRCLKHVEQGSYDAAIDSVSRDKFVHGKNPTAFFPLAIYVRDNFPMPGFSWELMEGKRVGMVNGYYYSERIQAFDGWTEDRSADENQLVRMLNASRFDYILLDILSAPIISRRNNITLKQLEPLIDSSSLYLLFNHQKEVMMRKYDGVISDMIEDGFVDDVYQKHLPFSYRRMLESTSAVN